MIRLLTSRPFFQSAVATTTTPVLTRALSITPITMGEGDTGAPKDTGSWTQKDQFTRREAAQEALYIKNQEMEKLKALQEKLKKQEEHVQNLDKQAEEASKGQGNGN